MANLNNDVYAFIGQKIKELRTSYRGAGIKQEELAKEINVQPNAISRWETCTYKPKINDLKRLADFFGVSISEFFPEKTRIDANEKIVALTRLSGELPEEDLEELIEYARFKRARRVLEQSKK